MTTPVTIDPGSISTVFKLSSNNSANDSLMGRSCCCGIKCLANPQIGLGLLKLAVAEVSGLQFGDRAINPLPAASSNTRSQTASIDSAELSI